MLCLTRSGRRGLDATRTASRGLLLLLLLLTRMVHLLLVIFQDDMVAKVGLLQQWEYRQCDN